jgi:hypothetical protein
MTRGIKMLLIAPFAIAGLVLVIFLGGEIVKQLWNWLMPSIFGVRPLTFWEAAGMLALCRILFGGVSGRGFSGRSMRDYSERRAQYRERFRQRVRERFGFDEPPSGTTVPN